MSKLNPHHKFSPIKIKSKQILCNYRIPNIKRNIKYCDDFIFMGENFCGFYFLLLWIF